MHPGDLPELFYQRDPEALEASLLKAMADFKDSALDKAKMLISIRSSGQFANPDLAYTLAKLWRVQPPKR